MNKGESLGREACLGRQVERKRKADGNLGRFAEEQKEEKKGDGAASGIEGGRERERVGDKDMASVNWRETKSGVAYNGRR